MHKCALKFIFFFSTFGAVFASFLAHLKHRTPSFTLYQAPPLIADFPPPPLFFPRQDFRELVKDLYKIYRARIWLRTFLNRYPPDPLTLFLFCPTRPPLVGLVVTVTAQQHLGGGVGHVGNLWVGQAEGGADLAGFCVARNPALTLRPLSTIILKLRGLLCPARLSECDPFGGLKKRPGQDGEGQQRELPRLVTATFGAVDLPRVKDPAAHLLSSQTTLNHPKRHKWRHS